MVMCSTGVQPFKVIAYRGLIAQRAYKILPKHNTSRQSMIWGSILTSTVMIARMTLNWSNMENCSEEDKSLEEELKSKRVSHDN